MHAKENPFEAGHVDNFPSFSNLFEHSPSIDTIARTKPQFSLHNSINSSRTQQHSPWEGGAPSVHSSSAVSRSPRQPRPRVAKQLNFSLPPASREGAVSSRSIAAAAGWPTHAVVHSGTPRVDSHDGYHAGAVPDEESTKSADDRRSTDAMHVMRVPNSVAVQTDKEPRTSERTLPSAAVSSENVSQPSLNGVSSKLPRLHPQIAPSSATGRLSAGMPRSPSAPALRQSRGAPSAVDPSEANRDSKLDAKEAPFSERIEEVRQVLLQPPSFEFTQYLRALLQRLPQRPLPRARLSELGLSPARARNVYGASGPMPDATPMPPQYAYAPWAASHGSIPMAPMQGMWPPYPYWPVQAYPLQMVPQPGYWTVAPPVWPTPWSSTSAPAPSPPPPPLPPYFYAGGAPTPWSASQMWPSSMWPSVGAFSTSALPGRRELFKYVQ